MIAIILWILIVPAFAGQSDREKDGLLGPVKNVRFESSGNGKNNGILLESVEYDPRGNKKAWVFYKTDGSPLVWEIFEYDTANNLTVAKTYNSAGNKPTIGGGPDAELPQKIRIYRYDTRGNKIEDALYGPDAQTPIRKFVYIYNDLGIPIEERRINGPQTEKILHRVDVDGKPLEDVYFDTTGKPVRKRLYTYDPQGDLAREILSTNDGMVAEKREIVPEPNDGKRERIFAIHEGVLYKIRESAHDKNGNLTEKTVYSATGVLRKKWVHVYGETGGITESRFFSDSENVAQSRWAYSYDTLGNPETESYYDKSGTLRFKRRFVGGTKKKSAEWTRFDARGTPHRKRTYRYDSAGNLRGWEDFDSRNAPVGKRLISASEQWIEPGQMRERSATFADDEFAYILLFDKHGNWIKKTVLRLAADRPQTGSADAPVYETRQTLHRIIEYYPLAVGGK